MIDYAFAYALTLVINIIPALMPPTWAVLAFAHQINRALDPVVLALGGAIFSTLGRYVLAKYVSRFKKRLVSRKRLDKMKILRDISSRNKFKSFFVVFLISLLTPFPSNALFIIVGLSGAFELALFLGFLLGRFVQYYIAIISLRVMLSSLEGVFAFSFLSVVVIDLSAFVILVLFSMIDWEIAIEKKKLRLIKF